MGNKIAKIDAEAMNSLYGSEFARLSGSKSAKDADWKDEKGAPHGPQAFEDHAEYIATLKSVMAEDEKTSGDPNDEITD
jgi:hypothetical protein